MVKKKAILRVGETHVQAVRDMFPGAELDAARQTEDQVTVTEPKDMLPEMVEFFVIRSRRLATELGDQ